jgi:hypothetical protein
MVLASNMALALSGTVVITAILTIALILMLNKSKFKG